MKPSSVLVISFLSLLVLSSLVIPIRASAPTVATIPVGCCYVAATYDSQKGEVFVANVLQNSVSVISDSSDSVIATVPVLASPISMAYDSDTGKIFVAD